MRKSASTQARSLHGGGSTQGTVVSTSNANDSQLTHSSVPSVRPPSTSATTARMSTAQLNHSSLFDGDITSSQPNPRTPVLTNPIALQETQLPTSPSLLDIDMTAAASSDRSRPRQQKKSKKKEEVSEVRREFAQMERVEETEAPAQEEPEVKRKKTKKKKSGTEPPAAAGVEQEDRPTSVKRALPKQDEENDSQLPAPPPLSSMKKKKAKQAVATPEQDNGSSPPRTILDETELQCPSTIAAPHTTTRIEETEYVPISLTQEDEDDDNIRETQTQTQRDSRVLSIVPAPVFAESPTTFFPESTTVAPLHPALSQDEEEEAAAAIALLPPTQAAHFLAPTPSFVSLFEDDPITTSLVDGTEEDFFERVLQNAGVQFESDHLLLKVPRNRFANAIRSSVRGSDRVRLFLLSLEAHISADARQFSRCLVPLRVAHDANETAGQLGRDPSLLQVLLRIDCLQSTLIQKLLDLFLFHALEETNADLPKRVLQSLCWLDFCAQPRELTTKLLETLHALNETESKWLADAVQALPEILPDAFHGEAVTALTKILKDTRTQSAPVISCLADLTIPTRALQLELIETVLIVLQSKPLEDLPVIVTFLLTSSATLADKDKQVYILKELRASLAFLNKTPEGEVESSNEALVVKELVHSMLLHPGLAQCFIDVCKAKETELVVVDVWLLIALSRTMPQVVRDCIKQRIANDADVGGNREEESTRIFRDAIVGHRAALEVCGMETAIDLASFFLRISALAKGADKLRRFGSNLFIWLFAANEEDLRVRQEIVHAIISHCCPGQKQEQEEEVDAALRCLDEIVLANRERPEALAPFASYVRSLMNELDRFNLFQARVLLRIVAKLTFLVQNQDEEREMVHGKDELKIFLRKYVMSAEPERQCLGIAGTIQLACSLAPPAAGQRGSDVREAMSLLDSMLRETRHPFCFDELARAIEANELSAQVVSILGETLREAFEEWFLFEVRAPVVFGAERESLDEVERFGLESAEAINGSSVKILPMLSRAQTDTLVRNRVPLLCPMLRCLLATSIKEGVALPEALLSCPVILPDAKHLVALELRPVLVREIVCSSMFSACNWIREVVSSFSPATNLDAEAQVLLLRRLGSLVEAENHLFIALKQCPQFCETLLHTTATAATAAATTAPVGRKRAKQQGSGEGKKHMGGNNEGEEEDEGEAEEVAPGEEEKTVKRAAGVGKTSVDSQSAMATAAMASALRELSPHALNILAIPNLKLVFVQPTGDGSDGMQEEEFLGGRVVTGAAAFADAGAESNGPEMHVSTLRLLLESCVKHLNQHVVEKVAFGRKRKQKHVEDELTVERLCVLFNEKALPTLSRFLQVLCSRIIAPSTTTAATSTFPPPQEVKDTLHCIELILGGVLSKLLKLHQQHTVPAKLLLQALQNFTIRDENARATTLPLCLRGAYAFLSQTASSALNSESVLLNASFPIQVTLCSLLRDVILLHNDLVKDSQERIEFKDKLSKLSLAILSQEWPLAPGSKSYFAVRVGKTNVGLLLELFHDFSSQPLVALTHTTEEIQTCLQKDAVSMPLLTSKTVGTFYSATLDSLARGAGSNGNEEEDGSMAMCSVFADCISFTKLDKISNAMLRDAMRYGRIFLDSFIKFQMPKLTTRFKRNQTQVMDVLGVMQRGTRQLQNLCTHAKTKKDGTIMQATPALRKALEAFICSIKAMLTEYNCLETSGFFVGVLKARNLNGSLVAKPPPQQQSQA